jgi:hypothetical protein
LAREAAIALGVAGAVAVITTWPLVLRLNHAAPDPFDPRFQAWTIDWVQHAIGDPARLFDANIFHPEPRTLAYSDNLIGLAVPLLPLRWMGMSPIGVWNVALLVGYATSGMAGYLFGRVVAGSRVVGAVCAAAFAFGAFGTYESNHVQVVAHLGVGLAGVAVWLLADRIAAGRRPLAPAVGLAAALAWQGSVSFYGAAYGAVLAIVTALARRRDLGRRGAAWVAGAVSVAGAVVGALAIPYLERRAALPTFRWTLRDLTIGGADFAKADARLWLWGRVIPGGPFPPPLFPGLTLLGLGALGLWRGRDRRAARTGVALVALGAFLALGTADEGWRRWSPYRLLFEHVPGWNALRGTSRGWMVGLAGLGVLAGLGAIEVARAVRRRWPLLRAATATSVAAAVAVGGVLVEGFRPFDDLAEVRVGAVDRELARRPEPGGVLYLPAGGIGPAYLGILDQTDTVYRSTAHHRPTPNGYAAFFPPSYHRMARIVRDLPSPAALGYLQDIGVRFVVVRAGARGTPWEHLFEPGTASPLRLLGRYGGDVLYEVPPPAPGRDGP